MSNWFSRLLSWKRNTRPSHVATDLLKRSRLIVDEAGRFDDASTLAHEVARLAYLTDGLLRFEEIDCDSPIHRVTGRAWTMKGTVKFTITWRHIQELLRMLNALLESSGSDERFARFVEGTTSGVMFAATWEVRGLRREGVLFPALDMN